MTVGVAEMQAALTNRPGTQLSNELLTDVIGERIRQVLHAPGDAQAIHPMAVELPPLMRQYLLRESWRAGIEVKLRVPAGNPWPSITDWTRHGIKAFAVDGDLVLAAAPWRPGWLDSGDRGVFANAFTEQNVRADGRCEADPFIAEATAYAYYSCPGQREAVRAAFLIRP